MQSGYKPSAILTIAPLLPLLTVTFRSKRYSIPMPFLFFKLVWIHKQHEFIILLLLLFWCISILSGAIGLE